MSAVLVDSNVLLDIMTEDPRLSWFTEALAGAAKTSLLVINPIIYGDVSVLYSRIEDLDDALSQPSAAKAALVPWLLRTA